MYGVTAWEHCNRSYRVKQKLAADRTVLVHAVGHAHMAALHGYAVAAVAGAAVEEITAATDPAGIRT